MLWKLSIAPIREGLEEYFFIVIEHHGKLSQTIGRHVKSRYMLTFSEGYYLLNNERATLDNCGSDFHLTILEYLEKNYDASRISDFIRKIKTISKLIYNGFIVQDELVFSPDSMHSKKNPKIPPIGTLRYLPHPNLPVSVDDDLTVIYSVEDDESNPMFLRIEPISNFSNSAFESNF